MATAQSLAVSDIVDAAGTARANPREAIEATADNRVTVMDTSGIKGEVLTAGAKEDDGAFFHPADQRFTVSGWMIDRRWRPVRRIIRHGSQCRRCFARRLGITKKIPDLLTGRTIFREQVVHAHQCVNSRIGDHLVEDPLLEQPHKPVERFSMNGIDRLQGGKHVSSDIFVLDLVERSDQRRRLRQQRLPFLIGAIADKRLLLVIRCRISMPLGLVVYRCHDGIIG